MNCFAYLLRWEGRAAHATSHQLSSSTGTRSWPPSPGERSQPMEMGRIAGRGRESTLTLSKSAHTNFARRSSLTGWCETRLPITGEFPALTSGPARECRLSVTCLFQRCWCGFEDSSEADPDVEAVSFTETCRAARCISGVVSVAMVTGVTS